MKDNLIAETSINIDASPAEVWKALTTPSLIKEYLMGTDVSSDWKEGSAITYKGTYKGKEYYDKGVIKKVEPEQLFQSTYLSSMSGKEDIPENYILVTYKLTKRDDKTVVSLSQDNNSTEIEKEHSIENWNTVLEKLKEVVESDNA